MKSYRIIGIMSGTSLDGVDLASCIFEESESGYTFELGPCETIPYDETWLSRLKNLPQATALEYAETHTAYGRYLGELTRIFIQKNHVSADFVASHGHTIFHNPKLHYTSQIGEGAALAFACGLPVVCDFRTGDVAAGGHGAPLVPIGDQLLFPDFEYCLNLGGFANISMHQNGKRVAFDISPANIILNHIANQAGRTYDKDGELAASGKIHNELLETLNALGYYHMPPPKSLGREWIEKEILPMLIHYNVSPADAACTFCEHISIQIAASLQTYPEGKMLITGGGAFNRYLIERMAAYTRVTFVIPDPKIINYKEALIFAYLGLRRMQVQPNCLASVTGASFDVSGGAVYLPPSPINPETISSDHYLHQTNFNSTHFKPGLPYSKKKHCYESKHESFDCHGYLHSSINASFNLCLSTCCNSTPIWYQVRIHHFCPYVTWCSCVSSQNHVCSFRWFSSITFTKIPVSSRILIY